jgi:hypothetical protein
MYLRGNRRFKDGKEHCYWNIVEAKRCADGRVVSRQVLYLGATFKNLKNEPANGTRSSIGSFPTSA